MKTRVLESLFNKVAGLQVYNFIKETLTRVFSCGYCEIFENVIFKKNICKQLLLTAYHMLHKNLRKDKYWSLLIYDSHPLGTLKQAEFWVCLSFFANLVC